MFDEESSSDRLNPADILGHLLLVWSVDYIPHSPTQYSQPDKPSDVILVDVVDLDLPDENGHQGFVARRAWWRQSRLIRDLKPRIGRPAPYLLRLGKDTSRPGANAPYVIIPALGDPDSRARGEAWLAAHPDFRPSERFETATPVSAPTPQAPAAVTYQQPVAVPYAAPQTAPVSAPPPLPPPPPRLSEPQKTTLERLAEQAQRTRDVYGGQGQPETPPF